jgi:hypothetical protein
MSADQQPDQVGRPAQPPAQIFLFRRGPGSHVGDQVADHIGSGARVNWGKMSRREIYIQFV